MPLRLAINGYGRIGRCFLRAIYESPYRDELRVVAINEPADLESITYLTRFDSTHGRFPGHVACADHLLLLDGEGVAVSHAREPEAVDWRGMGIDLVVECSGQYAVRDQLQRFIDAGAPRLLLSHPAQSADDVDATVVFGVNHAGLTGAERIVSNASCTTNAVVPVLAVLDEAFGVEQVLLTTIHSVMNDQPLIDGYHHTDLRRTRSAMQSVIPVSTGLARGIERLLPSMAGRVQAKALRVPTTNVSAIDMSLVLKRTTDVYSLNLLLRTVAEGGYAGLLAYSEAPHASIDFNHEPCSAIIDGSQTRVGEARLVSVFIWFDNEWGFANRMVDVTRCWQKSWESHPGI